MEAKELLAKITLPDGWVIDEEKSNGNEIVLKKEDKPKRFIDDKYALLSGFYIASDSGIYPGKDYSNSKSNYNVFVTKKQAKSAIAMAYIGQIMANDERFGGVVTDEEWDNEDTPKYVITRRGNQIAKDNFYYAYQFLAFHTKEQRDLFLEENRQLVKDFLMID